MGDLERKNGRVLEAIEHYKAALKASPGLLVAYNGLGLSYHRLERWKLAREWYQKGLEHRPNDPEINNNLGSTYFLSGRPQKAHARFHRARIAAPQEALYWRNEAMMLKHMEKLDACESLLKEGMMNHPSDPGLRTALESLSEARQIKRFLRKD
jgi:Flp pilus assembly protein TadD